MAPILITSLIFSLSSLSLFAKDFGKQGHAFPVAEENIIDHLTKKLNESDLGHIQNKVQSHYKKAFLIPQPVAGIEEAKVYSVHYFDPTIVVNQTITDHEGKSVIQKGTRVNPLETYSLQAELLFFDGDQPEHVAWACDQTAHTTWILVKGDPLKLEEQENRPVYFDQGGILSAKLKIKAIPAKVSQNGLKLKVEVIPARGHPCD